MVNLGRNSLTWAYAFENCNQIREQHSEHQTYHALFSPYKRSKFHNSIPPEQAHHHLNMVSISGPYREMQIIFHLLIQRTQEKALLRSKLVALTTCKQAKSYHSWLLIFLGQCLHFLATRKCFLSSIPQLVSQKLSIHYWSKMTAACCCCPVM